MKDKTLIIVLVVIVLAVALGLGYFFLTEDREEITTPDTPTTTTFDENMNFSAQYVEDNTWEYNITGFLPDPCHKFEIDYIVMESFPEQVLVTMEIWREDEMCIQVIQDVEESGTFQASEDADISFEII